MVRDIFYSLFLCLRSVIFNKYLKLKVAMEIPSGLSQKTALYAVKQFFGHPTAYTVAIDIIKNIYKVSYLIKLHKKKLHVTIKWISFQINQ